MVNVSALGIDLAPVRSGIAFVQMNDTVWTSRLWASQIGRTIEEQIAFADMIGVMLKKLDPDIVGLENYTMQAHSHVAFSFGEVGGLVRRVLWEDKRPTFLIPPGARFRTVPLVPKQEFYRTFPSVWKMSEKDMAGDKKSQEDKIDACAYAVIAAFGYKLLGNQLLTLGARLQEVYWNKSGSGLLDRMAGYRLEGLDRGIDVRESNGETDLSVRQGRGLRLRQPAGVGRD
jgi:hypothetical protein